jgi:hypothetical protein
MGPVAMGAALALAGAWAVPDTASAQEVPVQTLTWQQTDDIAAAQSSVPVETVQWGWGRRGGFGLSIGIGRGYGGWGGYGGYYGLSRPWYGSFYRPYYGGYGYGRSGFGIGLSYYRPRYYGSYYGGYSYPRYYSSYGYRAPIYVSSGYGYRPSYGHYGHYGAYGYGGYGYCH